MHVLPLRPNFLPPFSTQLAPLTHCELSVHTPSPLTHRQATVHARSLSVSQTGLSTHTMSLVDVPAATWSWFEVHAVQALQEAAFVVVENLPFSHSVHVLFIVAL